MAFLQVLAILFVIIGLLAYLTLSVRSWARRRCGVPTDGRAHGRALCGLCLACGPVVGFLMAGLHLGLNEVNPLDVGSTIFSFTAMGAIVGIVTGLAIGSAALLAQGPRPPARRKGP
jgi:hypothetical protein